jgi:hypothetical protein
VHLYSLARKAYINGGAVGVVHGTGTEKTFLMSHAVDRLGLITQEVPPVSVILTGQQLLLGNA